MIFISNKYTRIYYSIISNAKTRTLPKEIYTEEHHVIPRSLGGDNSVNNLVNLTAREHFVCHHLLTKMTDKGDKKKMLSAFWFMLNLKSKYKSTARVYEHNKAMYSKMLSERHTGCGNPNFGKTTSEATLIKIKTARAKQDNSHLKNRIITPEWREKIKQTLLTSSNTKGIPKSDKTKERMRKPKSKHQCQHCNGWFAPHIINRWHGINCKQINTL